MKTRQLRQRLRPVRHHFVRAAQHVEPTFISSDRAEAGVRGLTLQRLARFADDEARHERRGHACNDD